MAGYSYLSPDQMRAVEDFRRRAGVDKRDRYTLPRFTTGGEARPTQTLASRPYMSGPELYRDSRLTDARRMGGTARAGSTPPAGMDGIAALRNAFLNYKPTPSANQYVSALSGLKDGASRGIDSILNSFSRDREQRAEEALYNVAKDRMGTGFSPGDPRNPINAARPERAVPAPVRSIQRGAPDSLASTLEGLRRAPSFRPFPARPGSARLAPTSGADAVRRARPTPPISGGPVETDPEKIARVIANRPRRETPSEALSRGDAQAAIFSAGGDPRSQQLAAEAGAHINRTAGATLRGETPMRRLPSGRLVYAAVAPGTRQVDTSARGTVGDQTQGEVFPGAVDAVGDTLSMGPVGSGVGQSPDRRIGQGFGVPFPVEAVAIPSESARRTRVATPKPPRTVARPAQPEGPSTSEYPLGPNDAPVDPEISDSQYNEDPMGDASQSAVATKIATTSAKDLPNPNEKAIKKGFFENANMGMVEFGLRMASAASKPGATALGAAADAGVAMIDSKALRDAKKADTEFKQAMQKGLIDARASEGKKDRAERVARATAETNAAFRLQRERLNSTEGISVEELKLKNKQLSALEKYQLEKIRVESEGIKSTSVNSQRNLIQELVKTSGAIAKANNISVSGMTPAKAVEARLEMFTDTLQGVIGNSLIYNSLDEDLVASYLPSAPTTAPAAGTGTGTGAKRTPKVGDAVTQKGVKTTLTQEMIDKMPKVKN